LSVGSVLLPIDIRKYEYLFNIVNETYNNTISCENVVDGACDTNWNSEYALFYDKQPNSKPYVARLLFKRQGKGTKKIRVGFANIRPITDGSEVAETYLNPPKNLETTNAFIKCLAVHNVYGERVRCVPFIMPESIFGMCIQASIWICLSVLENQGMIDNVPTIPEIQRLATGRPYTDKQGLQFVQASRLLKMCRTSAFYINNKETTLNDDMMLMQLYAYIESKLPVIIGVDVADLKWWNTRGRHCYHSLVVIGHTMSNNKVDGFIVHDESALPYQVMSETELKTAWHKPEKPKKKDVNHECVQTEPPSNARIRELLVAVPPAVSLPFHKVYNEFYTMLNALRVFELFIQDVDALKIRPMLMPPEQLLFDTKPTAKCLFRAMSDANFPEYIWVIYFTDVNGDWSKPKGFFVRDATRRTSFVLVYMFDKGTAIYQLEEGKTYQIWDNVRTRKLIKGASKKA